MYNQNIIASMAYKSTINKKRVIEILSAIDKTTNEEQRTVLREELYSFLKDKYGVLKKVGVLKYHLFYQIIKYFYECINLQNLAIIYQI